jgi:serine/threonine protein kinase
VFNLAYCQCYSDLKPENLLMATKNDDANVKLADFGFACIADGFSITSQCGTPGKTAVPHSDAMSAYRVSSS